MTNHVKIEKIKKWLGSGCINIFGLPFAGKDTQGKLLAKELGGELIGGGDILRSAGMPSHIQDYMRGGELIPTDEYVSIVIPFLSKPEFEGKPLILNSVGRWHGEEDYVLHATNASEHPLKVVLHLQLNEGIVRQRWNELAKLNDRGNRHDDTEEVLEVRLKESREKTLPVIETYKSMGIVITVDATKSRDEVYQEIIDGLYEFASRDEASQ